jgi:predicted GNAT family acetyltransferase
MTYEEKVFDVIENQGAKNAWLELRRRVDIGDLREECAQLEAQLAVLEKQKAATASLPGRTTAILPPTPPQSVTAVTTPNNDASVANANDIVAPSWYDQIRAWVQANLSTTTTPVESSSKTDTPSTGGDRVVARKDEPPE